MSLLEKIESLFSKLIASNEIKIINKEDTLKIICKNNYLTKVVKRLKENEGLKFNQLTDIVAVDYPSEKKRFELVYIFLSISFN